MSDSGSIAYAKKARRRAATARNFPTNTCPASRHLHLMADCLMGPNKYDELRYPMFRDEPEHCAASIYDVITALWKARTELERLKGPGYTPKARKAK
jgi:hypothetical protein